LLSFFKVDLLIIVIAPQSALIRVAHRHP